ncbi:hypothetical protein ACFFGT_18280 [Mucilaginibacter angelicae]|uniref:DUF4369 domain-containing protein n=1 Tax=Mucilaginibacter angelicae TaxID=869718 RepID=A0ABV6L9M9_9SPHI
MRKFLFIFFLVALIPVIACAQATDTFASTLRKQINTTLLSRSMIFDGILLKGDLDSTSLTFINPNDTLLRNEQFSHFADSSYKYVVDGKQSDRNFKGLKLKDVHSVEFIKQKTDSITNAPTSFKIIIVTTREYAVKQYKQGIGALSKEYESYLEKHHNDDSNLIYIINGHEYKSMTSVRIEQLYNILSQKATYNEFSLYYVMGHDSIPPSVEIKAK